MVQSKRAPRVPVVNIRVELFGQARVLTGRREVNVQLPEDAHTRDVVKALSDLCPALVGSVISEGAPELMESYTLNLNGTAFVQGERLHLKPGDSLLVFSSQAGG